MRYLSVKNLDKYQHYKDRDPKWIKLYYSILDDPIFMILTEVERCRYMTCLIIASRTENKIPSDPTYLKKVMRLDKAPDLSRLISLGFLVTSEPSSSSLDTVYQVEMGPNQSLLSSPLLNSLNSPETNQDLKSIKHSKKSNGVHEFPDDFVFDDSIKSNWASHGIDPGIEFAKFRDHHRARGTKFSDWKAAWRNWARNAIKFKEERDVRSMR